MFFSLSNWWRLGLARNRWFTRSRVQRHMRRLFVAIDATINVCLSEIETMVVSPMPRTAYSTLQAVRLHTLRNHHPLPCTLLRIHLPIDNRAWLLPVLTRLARIRLSFRDSSRHGNPSFPSLNTGGSLARPHPNQRLLQTLTSCPSRRISSSRAPTSPPSN